MPFTGSHPAAVLPFARILPASALIVGSMAPDAPYYLPGHQDWATHTLLGIVTVDLLMGLAIWLMWHGLLADAATYAAPTSLRARLTGVRKRRTFWILPALALGSATHVLWDEFTHDDRWGTAHLALLRDELGPLPGWQTAQYASGLAGALVLAVWVVRWWRRTPAVPVPARSTAWVWLLIVGVAAVVGVAAALAADSVRAGAFAGATRGGTAGGAVALVLAVWWRVRRRGA